MLILLSPAKTLDFKSAIEGVPTKARFVAEAGRIARAAAKLGPRRLAELMHISPALAELNDQRFRRFARAEARPAIHAFAGDVYRGFDAASADEDTLAFAQDHIRILSGLYGLLRPMDAIRPHRLEMGTRWGPGGAGRLIDHWGDRVATALATDVRKQGSKIVINLASNEYFSVVKGRLPKRIAVIAPEFRVRQAGELKVQSFAAKVARGAMARWICDGRVDEPVALRGFDRDGWRFHPDTSTPARPVFVRD